MRVFVFIRSIPLFAAKPENLANRFGNHEFFIGADYADRRLTAELWLAWSTPPGLNFSSWLLGYPQQPPVLYAGLAPAGADRNFC